jgi:hypothetical protein
MDAGKWRGARRSDEDDAVKTEDGRADGQQRGFRSAKLLADVRLEETSPK